METIDLLLIAVGLSMDAFAVSVTNGMTMLKIKVKHALSIAFAFGFFQGLMPAIGYFLGSGFAGYINAFGHWIALILLLAIGGKMIFEGKKHKDGEESKIRCFSLKLLVVQAVATSIDALMVGVTFAAMSVSIFYSVHIIAVITFVISFFGVYIGKKFGDMFKANSEILGGAILVLIGLKIFTEHMIKS